jgi:hypothetical protein
VSRKCRCQIPSQLSVGAEYADPHDLLRNP